MSTNKKSSSLTFLSLLDPPLSGFVCCSEKKCEEWSESSSLSESDSGADAKLIYKLPLQAQLSFSSVLCHARLPWLLKLLNQRSGWGAVIIFLLLSFMKCACGAVLENLDDFFHFTLFLLKQQLTCRILSNVLNTAELFTSPYCWSSLFELLTSTGTDMRWMLEAARLHCVLCKNDL